MDILSLQSRVTWGHVGNAIAVPTLGAFGVRGRPVDTVRLARHPGHGPTPAFRTPAAEIEELMTGALAMIAGPVGLLTGYLGNAEQGRAALGVRAREAAAGRALPLFLDPVFGDDAEGTYVAEDLVAFIRDEAVPAAALVMPNRYELAALSGRVVDGPETAARAAASLIAAGPRAVLVSSVPMADGRIGNVLVSGEGAWLAPVPPLDLRAKGTGDMLSAAFAALWLQETPPAEALGRAVQAVHLAATTAARHNLTELDPRATLEPGDGGPTKIAVEPLVIRAHDRRGAAP